MKLSFLLFSLAFLNIYATGFNQEAKLTMRHNNVSVKTIFREIEKTTDYRFVYNDETVSWLSNVNVNARNKELGKILDDLLHDSDIEYRVLEDNLIVLTKSTALQEVTVTGTVTDEDRLPIPGVSVVIEGTTIGVATNIDGKYSLVLDDPDVVLVFSYVGYQTTRIAVEGRREIDVQLSADFAVLDEVVVIGYGTQRRVDLTGSVARADVEAFRLQPNVSLLQSLHGSVAGLNVGQVDRAGQNPSLSVRGLTTISGTQDPLIVLDGVIFRGNIIDLNPADIESVDILKDASAVAVYGSQATNGVILITTTRSGGIDGKPVIRYSGHYAYQQPAKYFPYPNPEDHASRLEWTDFYQSKTEESGYTEPNPDYHFSSLFNTAAQLWAYEQGITTNWYDLTTRDNMHTQNHNLSISNKTKFNNYFVSIGYSDQMGYMLNEDYTRYSARINIDNTITDWLTVGAQTFLTQSDFSGATFGTRHRYEHHPWVPLYDQTGELNLIPGGQFINPLIVAEADDHNKVLNLSGNLYANLIIPYIEGLSYRVNLSNFYRNSSNHRFENYGANFRGSGYKQESYNHDMSADNIVTYNQTFNDLHSVTATLVYGIETRNFNSTYASAQDFPTTVLGYNRLQMGNTEMQTVSTSAWDETSIYQMARLFYGYASKYLITGTFRRDGFSGFSEKHKIGTFPSLAFAWVASNESFIDDNIDILDYLKFRISYGSTGNRTISRYQTLSRLTGGYYYIDADKNPLYAMEITSLASPNLKWETTTGTNLGIDFGILGQRLMGTIDYYNNNTTNLLYDVDIPGIGRFEKFPDNLGRLHNKGLELSLSSMNIRRSNLTWRSEFVFSRNRNTLKELLGIDRTGDGKEDDLIAEGLFIGESLSAIYTYEITGEFWQLDDDVPAGYMPGSYRVRDLDGDGVITPENDRKIIGYRDPSYRFSVNNMVQYNNWTLRIFINSIQGGNKYYLGEDHLRSWALPSLPGGSSDRLNIPVEIDFWTPANPVNATYHAPGIQQTSGIVGERWIPRSFIRLQDVSLSYRFSPDLLRNLNIHDFTVYISGKNLYTWTKWPGWDPETGQPISRDGRPVLRSYTLGVNVGF